MKRILPLLALAAGIAGSAGAQDIDLMSLEWSGSAVEGRFRIDRRSSADTTAYLVHEEDAGGWMRLKRVDVNAAGTCWYSETDERGQVHFIRATWDDLDHCRDFYFVELAFDTLREHMTR